MLLFLFLALAAAANPFFLSLLACPLAGPPSLALASFHQLSLTSFPSNFQSPLKFHCFSLASSSPMTLGTL